MDGSVNDSNAVSNGRVYVRRKIGEVFSYNCTTPTFKKNERGLMIWGCMCVNGVGQIVLVNGKMDSRVYLNILKEVALPEGRRLIGDNFVFQQDNATIHTSTIVKQYLSEQQVTVLEWPPQIPIPFPY